MLFNICLVSVLFPTPHSEALEWLSFQTVIMLKYNALSDHLMWSQKKRTKPSFLKETT